MHTIIKRILSLAIICIMTVCTMPAHALTSNLDEIGFADVSARTNWATEQNLRTLTGKISNDFKEFAGTQTQLVDDYVPAEAKVGLAMINGLASMSDILDMSLMRFAMIFIIIAYAFWLMLETYKMMKDGKGAIMPLAREAVNKGLIIAVWFMVLDFGPIKVFMWVMGPIIGIGTYMSDLILNAITGAAGISLPDTCAAIHEYTIDNTPTNLLIDANGAADLMCIPSRMSGLFQTAIAAGWEWMRVGIGSSALTFVTGLVFVCLFSFNAWKFAIMAFGVIADLFLGVLMLPFTAISQTVSKTSYKGVAGTVYNAFAGIFKAESLDAQITRFVNASLYFISLSIVIGTCTALLATTVDTNLADAVPTIETAGFITTLLTGCLVLYLAMQTDKMMSDLGGKIDTTIGKQISDSISGLWKAGKAQGSAWYKAWKKG